MDRAIDVVSDAYYDERQTIQNHYAAVFKELSLVRQQLNRSLADNPLYEPILRAMIFIRTQTITNIGFEVKEFNQTTCDDFPISYYPSPMGGSEIARLQKDVELLDRVKEGHVYGNIFSAKSLVYVACPRKREDIPKNAAQIFPITIEQFGSYVNTIGQAITGLQTDVEANGFGDDSILEKEELFEGRQNLLEQTMRQLNQDILGPMNDWRDAYMGQPDDKSEVSRREMKL